MRLCTMFHKVHFLSLFGVIYAEDGAAPKTSDPTAATTTNTGTEHTSSSSNRITVCERADPPLQRSANSDQPKPVWYTVSSSLSLTRSSSTPNRDTDISTQAPPIQMSTAPTGSSANFRSERFICGRSRIECASMSMFCCVAPCGSPSITHESGIKCAESL
jgi:hypothetical protein